MKYPSEYIVGMRVDVLNYETATDQILQWSEERSNRRVCVANVHMAMESHDDKSFNEVVNRADMVTSDGMPLVWALKILGHKDASRVYGPDLLLEICRGASKRKIPIGLYGGTSDRLREFKETLERRFPDIVIACSIAPPFRPLTEDEDDAYTRELVESGVRIIFVGIGCPRQERWMADHARQIPATMIGVGAAFDFHSGHVRQAPVLLQRFGMEWAFRLAMEPRRLWKRYMKHNPRFVFLFLHQVLWSNRSNHSSDTSTAAVHP